MEMNELTEREQHYLNEWISHQEERPIKALMIISWSLIIILFLIFGGMCFSIEEAEISFYLTALGIPGSMSLILACFTGPLLKRLKKHRTYVYDKVQRTKILSKEVFYCKPHRGPIIPVYYYRCEGIEGQITPISKKYYDMTKVGDDITVVKTSLNGIALGITFGDDGL